MGNTKKYSLPAIAATLGSLLAGKANTTVVFANTTTAKTDGKKVYLPSNLKDAASEDEADILRGFLAHEILGHIVNTDFAEYAKFAKKASPLGAAILNCIEDGRIERAAWRSYPAVKGLLKKCMSALLRQQEKNGVDYDAIPPEGLLVSTILMNVRKDLGQDCDPSPFEERARAMFGDELCTGVVNLALKGAKSQPGLAGTEDVIVATKAILALLESQSQGQGNDQGESQGNDQGESQGNDQGQGQSQGNDQGQGQSQGNDQGQGQSQGSDQGQGQSQGNDQGESQGQGNDQGESQGQGNDQGESQGQGNDQGQSQGQGNDQGQSRAKAARDALSGQNPGISDIGQLMVSVLTDKSSDSGHHNRVVTKDLTTTDLVVVRGDIKTPPSVDAKAAANALGVKVERYLETRTYRRDVYHDDGKLCGRKLVHAVCGEKKVFRQVSGENMEMDVAVSLLIDCSGSMSGEVMEMAKATAYAVADAFSRYESQVNVEILGFNNKIISVKKFEEAFLPRKQIIGGLYASGGTRFQATLLGAVKSLSKRPEKRKVVLFLTDGDLGTNPGTFIGTLQLEGIELRGVFIGDANDKSKAVSEMFEGAGVSNFGFARSAAEIPGAVFSALERDFFDL